MSMTIQDLENIITSYDLDFRELFLNGYFFPEHAKHHVNKIKIQDIEILCGKDAFTRGQCDLYFAKDPLPEQTLELFFQMYFLNNWRTFRFMLNDFERQLSDVNLSLEDLVKVLPLATMLEVKNIIASTNGLKNLQEWSETKEYTDALLIDSVSPGFVDIITKHLTFKIDENIFFNKINQFNNREELKKIMKEILNAYGSNRYFLNSKFLKQYHEEIIPINQLLQSNKITDGWEKVQFSIQDPSKSKEDSFDALLTDAQNNTVTRIECVCILDDWEHKRALNIFMGKYGRTDINSRISTEKGAYEWIKNNSQPPISTYTFDVDTIRKDMVEKIIKAFNKKNSKVNYKEWNGNIMLLINYPVKVSFNVLEPDDYLYIKKHIDLSNNQFLKGVFLLSPNTPIVCLS